MDVICPNCQKKLSLQDQYAGQLVRCPLCQGMFQAPALPSYAPPPLAPQPPGIANAPVPPPTPQPQQPGVVEEVVVEELPPGEYSKERTWHLRPDILLWVGPVCLGIIFLLSFFTWYAGIDMHELGPKMLWQGNAVFIVYFIFVLILAMPLSIVTLLMEKGIIPLPPNLRALLVWRPIALGGLVLIGFLLLSVPYIRGIFYAGLMPAVAMKLGYRLTIIALLSFVLEYWLIRRRAKNLPLPQVTMRW